MVASTAGHPAGSSDCAQVLSAALLTGGPPGSVLRVGSRLVCGEAVHGQRRDRPVSVHT